MIIKVIDGRVTATAETLAEVSKLCKMGAESIEVATPSYLKPKKFSRRSCILCQKVVHGKMGLVQHQRHVHTQEFIANGKHAIL